MIFSLLFGLACARPVEEALVAGVEFKLNSIQVGKPIYPPFASWDLNYSCLFNVYSSDAVEIKAILVHPEVSMSISVDSVAWEPLMNNTYTQVPLSTGPETRIMISTSYNDIHHTHSSYTYQFMIYPNTWNISSALASGQYACSGRQTDNNCTGVLPLNTTDLNITIYSDIASSLAIRHISYVNSSDYITLTPGAKYNYKNFFSNWLENILEVTVSNSSNKQVYYYRLHKQIPPNEISSTDYTSYMAFEFNGWDLMPRFHPQVYNYTLVSRLPSGAYGDIQMILNTYYVSYCEINVNPANFIPKYNWRTNTPSDPIFMSLGEDFLTFNCSSLAQDYFTGVYTVYYYRESLNTNIATVTAFLNPLVPSINNYSSSSSDIGYEEYLYSTSSLNSWSSIIGYKPPSNLILNYSDFSFFLPFDPIEYPLEPTGVTFLLTPENAGAHFEYSLNSGDFETDYFFSNKSLYPLVPGINTVYFNVIAEDPTVAFCNTYTIIVLSPDFTIENMTFWPVIFSNSSSSTYNVSSLQSNISGCIGLNNSNSIFEVYEGNNMIINDTSCFGLDLNTSMIDIEFELVVYAESRNYFQNLWLRFQRVDQCGDGKRWDSDEQCDDGNLFNGDGCYHCLVEPGWVCQGGSFYSPDLCIYSPTNTTNPSTANPASGPSNPNSNTNNNSNNATQDTPNNNTQSVLSNNTLNSTFTNETSTPNVSSIAPTNSTTSLSASQADISAYSYYIFLSLTLTILLLHIFIGVKSKKFVYKYNISGLNSSFIPMLHSVQLFYFSYTVSPIDTYNFYKSFKWILGTQDNNNITDIIDVDGCNMSKALPVFIGLSILVIVHPVTILFKNKKKFKGFYKLWNYSVYVHYFYFSSPLVLFYSVIELQADWNASRAAQKTLAVVCVVLIGTVLGLVYGLTARCSGVHYDKKVYYRFGSLYEGLKYFSKVVPINSLDCIKINSHVWIKSSFKQDFVLNRSGEYDNDKQDHDRINSFEISLNEEKPKSHSAPWKPVKNILESSDEISEFVISEPDPKPEAAKSTKLQFNYYFYNILCHYSVILSFILIPSTLGKVIVSVVISISNLVILLTKWPFVHNIYTITNTIKVSLTCIWVIIIGCIQNSNTILEVISIFISFFIFLVVISASLYEFFFFLETIKGNNSASQNVTKTKEFTESNDKALMLQPQIKIENRVMTEPNLIKRQMPPRNCYSFYEIDNTFLSV